MKTKPFSRMTASEKRVAIAEDVLDQIKADKYHMCSGTVLKTFDTATGVGIRTVSQQVFARDVNCSCCVTIQGNPLSADAFKKARNFFPVVQIQLIEHAYEQGEGMFGEKGIIREKMILNQHQQRAATRFGKRFTVNENRAIAIFKNIITNQGTFIP